jgi:enoyl-CoA hydratase/carnithine racemase
VTGDSTHDPTNDPTNDLPDAGPVRSRPVDGIAVVAIDRPHRANTLDHRTFVELKAAIDAAAGDPDVHALLLCSEGPHFCGGADLFDDALFGDAAQGPQRAVVDASYAVTAALLEFPKPTVCAVQGRSAGGGTALVLACDLRIASTRLSISVDFVRFGIVPDLGLTWMLPTMLGVGWALDLALGTDALDAEQAVRRGVVSEVVGDAELRPRALERARRLGAMPREAVVAARRLVRSAPSRSYATAVREERAALDGVLGAPDTIARRDAFLGDRSARGADAG